MTKADNFLRLVPKTDNFLWPAANKSAIGSGLMHIL